MQEGTSNELEVSKFQMDGIKWNEDLEEIDTKLEIYIYICIYRLLVQRYSNLMAMLVYTNDKYTNV